MNTKGTVAFNIIGTCFSLELPRTRLVELGAPTNTLQFWFAQTLRDAFALLFAGGYQPLLEVLKAELPRTLEKGYLAIYPQPEIVANNLVEAANKIIEVSS